MKTCWLVTEVATGHTWRREVALPIVFATQEDAEAYAVQKQGEWDGGDGSISRYTIEVEFRP